MYKNNLELLIKFFVVGIVLFVMGCSSNTRVINYIPADSTLIDVPDLGNVVKGSLGSTLVSKGFKNIYKGVHIKNTGCVGDCNALLNCSHRKILPNQRVPLNQQIPRGQRKSGGDAMCAVVKMQYAASNNCGASTHGWYVCKDENGWFSPDGTFRNDMQITAVLKEIDIVDIESPSFVQEFIFNGRYENNLKFIYREFSNDLARPSFTQEVQYDLGSGNKIGFKNLLIEVLNATNTDISFKVIRSF